MAPRPSRSLESDPPDLSTPPSYSAPAEAATKPQEGGADVFAWLAAVARAPGVGHFAVRVAVVLSGYFSRGDRAAWPKLTTIATSLGASPEGVRKALLQLRDGGHLAIQYGDGRGRLNVYRMLHIPQPLEGDSLSEPPTAVGPYPAEAPLAIGALAPEPPTAVGQNPQRLFAHGTSKAEPVDLSLSEERSQVRSRPLMRCPDGWLPSIAHEQLAMERGLSQSNFETALAKFRDHEFTRRPISDWDAAFRNWIRSERPSAGGVRTAGRQSALEEELARERGLM